MITLLLHVLLGADLEYPALVSLISEKERQRNEELRAAHDALDAGNFEAAVGLGKHARTLDAEIVALRNEARDSLKRFVADRVERLDDDEYAVREAAGAELRALGPLALPLLARHRRSPRSAEVRSRLDALLPGLTIDPDGRVRQWVSEASASSEYGTDDWSARQLVGPPDSRQGGDARTAWAALKADEGLEWIRVKFPMPVRIRGLRIFENDHPGALTAIDVVGPDAVRRRVWEGTDPGGPTPACVAIALRGELAGELILTLDTKRQGGWEEIDAVELIGELPD